MDLAPLLPVPRVCLGPSLLGDPFVGAVVRVLGPLAPLPGELACALAGRLRAIGLSGVLWTRPEGPAAAAASALCDHHARRSSLRSSRQCGSGAGASWRRTGQRISAESGESAGGAVSLAEGGPVQVSVEGQNPFWGKDLSKCILARARALSAYDCRTDTYISLSQAPPAGDDRPVSGQIPPDLGAFALDCRIGLKP